MTPCESFLFSKNISPIVEQFVLITFFILEYLYLFSYHTLNLDSFKMAELVKIEIKFTRYSHYSRVLQKYKNHRKYPKDLSLMLNLSLLSLQLEGKENLPASVLKSLM